MRRIFNTRFTVDENSIIIVTILGFPSADITEFVIVPIAMKSIPITSICNEELPITYAGPNKKPKNGFANIKRREPIGTKIRMIYFKMSDIPFSSS